MKTLTFNEITTFAELEELINSSIIKYDVSKIKEAFDYASELHKNDKRLSGKSMDTHLLTVASYIVKLNLDTTSVIASLLHKIVDLKHATIEEIDKKFGTEVAFIVDGLSQIKEHSESFELHNEDPDNFRKLMIASSEDIRILIIRLANKLYNSFSLDILPIETQKNQAYKLKLVYAPLCEYLGLGHFQSIFENTALKILNPTEYNFIKSYTDKIYLESQSIFKKVEDEILNLLSKYNVKPVSISYRTKNYSSTYNKIKKKYMNEGETLNETHIKKLKDLLGIRVILNTEAECYLVLGLIHGKWDYFPEEFDDYIIKPKASGYKSIHTVVDIDGFVAEIQIRTAEMHEYNEFGPASHIAYKLQMNSKKESFTWTKELVDWKNNSDEATKSYKIKAFSESVFVFTPKGKVVILEKGSTPLDFAYAVHTQIGDRCNGAYINKKIVTLDHVLQTGDVCEVITTKHKNTNRGWLAKCKMAETKSRIRRTLRAMGEE